MPQTINLVSKPTFLWHASWRNSSSRNAADFCSHTPLLCNQLACRHRGHSQGDASHQEQMAPCWDQEHLYAKRPAASRTGVSSCNASSKPCRMRASRAYSQSFSSPLQWRGQRGRASPGEALGNHFPLAAPQSWDTPLAAGIRQLLYKKTMLKPDHLSRGCSLLLFFLYQASWQGLPIFWNCSHCLCSGLTGK